MLGSKGGRGGIRGKIGRKLEWQKSQEHILVEGEGGCGGGRAGENSKERLTGLTKQNGDVRGNGER